MSGGLELYLCEQESVGDFDLKVLDITIATEPVGDSIIKTLNLSRYEMRDLSGLSRDDLRKELFRRGGITDLEPHYGLPKGPYYWVDESVYRAINRLNISAL